MGLAKHMIALLLVLSVATCFAQPDPIIPDPPGPHSDVAAEETPLSLSEFLPEYPGGETALLQFLAKNIQYPEPCVDSGVEGKVYIRFVVEKDGQVSNVVVLRQPQGDYGDLLGKEAVRVVRKLEKFKPGMQNGKRVRVYYTLPVTFKLTN